MDLGNIRVWDLSSKETAALEHEMAEVHAVLSRTALQLYGDDNAASIKRLRFHPDLAELYPYSWALIDHINGLGEKIVGAFVRVVVVLIESFHTAYKDRYPSLEEEDYLQEACAAIMDAAFCYDGQGRFTTYIYHCVKNRLRTFLNKERRQSAFESHIEELKMKPSTRSRTGFGRGRPVTDRRKSINQWDEGTEDVEDDIQSAEDLVETTEEIEHREEEVALQRRAIAEAPLTNLQRELITSRIEGELQKEFQGRWINPNTGRPYSRQALLDQFNMAKKVIVETFSRYQREVAA